MTGVLSDIAFRLKGDAVITVTAKKEDAALIQELLGQEVEISKFRKRRSLDANAYAWVLIGKIAAVTGQSPDDIYRECIRDVGGNYEIFPVRDDALPRFREIWQGRGVGWIFEEIGESKIKGYTNARCFFGSSSYDTAQMSRLIDRIVEDAKDLGIETKTPDEIENLKSLWGQK